MGVGLPQAPFWHVSPLVQALLSLQAVPLALFGFEHTPLIGSQVPAPWTASGVVRWLEVRGVPFRPFWHVSPLVQALLSLQAVPLALFGFEHTPLIGSQVPATWQDRKSVV